MTSFPVSADSPSASNGPGCEPSPSAKSIPIAAASSQNTGRTSPATETSEPLLPLDLPTDGIIAPMADAACTERATEPGGQERCTTRRQGHQCQALGLTVSMPSAADFPCQDISVAGKGAGIGGERSGLWSEYRQNCWRVTTPHTSSWRTSQLCLDGDYQRSRRPGRARVSMRNGIAYQLPPLVPLTDATGSGLWPTPTTGRRTTANTSESGEMQS